ncbi:MAG: hypothetical protein ABI233_05415 [Chthoniobacterales bacterium]
MKFVSLIAVVALAWFAYGRMTAPITYPPGVLVAAEPSQTALTPNDAPFETGKFHLQPLAHFTLDARVLHRKIYRYDRPSALVPVDLAVGWGAMSNQAVLDHLELSQSARFFWYEWRKQPPIPESEIIAHATNLHLIPSSLAIAKRCKQLRAGVLIHLRGLLVEATGPEIGTWRSSLSRTDTGNGACELVWVEELHDLAR